MKNVLVIALLSLASTNGFGQIDLESGLMAFYPFNQNSLDESGNDHHGEVNSATLTQDFLGNDDSAYFFDGIDDYIEIANSPNLDFEIQENFAISLLFRAEDVVSGQTSSDLLSKWNSMRLDSGYSYGIRMASQLAADPGRTFGVRYDSDATGCHGISATTSQENSIDGKWHHLVYQLNANDFLEMYLDGNLVESIEDRSVCTLVSQSSIIIGNRSVDRPIRPFKGDMDEIRIYNRSLNAEEIEFLNDNRVVSSLERVASGIVQVTPNPVSDFLMISNNSNISISEFKLFNMNGQLIDTFYSPNYTMSATKGVYILQMQFVNGESQSVRIVKS